MRTRIKLSKKITSALTFSAVGVTAGLGAVSAVACGDDTDAAEKEINLDNVEAYFTNTPEITDFTNLPKLPEGYTFSFQVDNGKATYNPPVDLTGKEKVTVTVVKDPSQKPSNVKVTADKKVIDLDNVETTVLKNAGKFNNPDLINNLSKGKPTTQAEMAEFFGQITTGDIIAGAGQAGVNIPTREWEELNAPTKNYVPAHIYAPYVDIGLSDSSTSSFGTVDGLKYASIAFVQQGADNRADGTLAGAITPDSEQFKRFVNNTNQLRAKGGDVILSFGGAAGTPIWEKENDPVLLAAYLIKLAQAGKFHQFDYDIEGNAQSNPKALQRLATATKLAQDYLESGGFRLDISLTLPVLPAGLTLGKGSLQTFWDTGVALKTINIMNFDYGQGQKSEADVTTAALQAIDSTAKQIQDVTNLTLEQSYQLVGSTHMPPDDDQHMPLSKGSADAIRKHAEEKNLSMLSIWSLFRDATMDGYNFTKSNGGYFESYKPSEEQASQEPFRAAKQNVDIYTTGAYKSGESAGASVVNVDPAKIPVYESGRTYHKGDIVKTEDGVFKVNYDTTIKPSGRQVNIPSFTDWTSMGSLEWYQNYYNTFLKQDEDVKVDTSGVDPYYFLMHNGQDFPDPFAATSATTDKSQEETFWMNNAWDWQPGVVARKGTVWKYKGQYWYAKWYITATPGSNVAWSVWSPVSQKVINYWTY